VHDLPETLKMNLQNCIVISFSILAWGQLTSSQGLPDQIQEFLQKSFFNPIKERVHEGVQEISGLLKEVINTEHGSNTTSTGGNYSETISHNASEAINASDIISSGKDFIKEVVQKLLPNELPTTLQENPTTIRHSSSESDGEITGEAHSSTPSADRSVKSSLDINDLSTESIQTL
jgi:hypothetical protein